MVKHIVCFKLKDNSEQSLQKAKEILLSMQGKVKTAKSITVNIDELRSPRSYDIILEVLVDNFDVLEEYQKDEYHVNVVKEYMRNARESSVAIDFTVE